MKTAIIGAGIAGLGAARRLQAAGLDVVLFDKGRGPGGRLSTRRAATPIGELRWDHGAPMFDAASSAFRAELDSLEALGAVTRWSPRTADIFRDGDGRTTRVRPDGGAVYTGQPAMNSVIKALADGLAIQWGRRVSALASGPGGQTLHFEEGSPEGPFGRVILAVPAEQAAVVLEQASPVLAQEAAAATSTPRWVAMTAFGRPVAAGWDVAHIRGENLSFAVRNAAKPGRDPGEAWVLHASAEWSRDHVDMPREEVAAALAGAFQEITGAPPAAFVAAHRWLYSEVSSPAGSPFGWDESARIAAIGDWRLGPRVEDAWTSGRACADYLTSLDSVLDI